jgi:hypothetical protein
MGISFELDKLEPDVFVAAMVAATLAYALGLVRRILRWALITVFSPPSPPMPA